MSLTGGGLLTLEVLLTVAAVAGVVVGWDRLGGGLAGRTGWLRGVSRIGALLLVNVLVVVTAATAVNAQFLFFADWQDLGGALGGARTTTGLQAGGTAAQAATRAVGGPAAVAAASLPALPTGSDPAKPISYTVTGVHSRLTATVVVQLPAGYTSPAEASTRYPVLETFSGYPGSPQQWVGAMGLGSAVTAQVQAHRMRPVLIVSPQLEIPSGRDTECVDGAGADPQLETWLTQDVPDWVARTFRVATDRASWATIGLSAGGWCAAMATMLHPAQYAAAIVMGGYFRPEFGPFFSPYPPGSALASRYDLVALERRSPQPVALWLETSHSDPVSYGSSAAFLKVVRKPTAVAATVLQHAGHRMDLWQGLLPQSLTWLGAQIPGFSPTAAP